MGINNFSREYYGDKHRIDYMLSYSLQMINNPQNFLEATKGELKKKNANEIVNFIKLFRSSLSTDILSSSEYSFKAILIQVRNHESNNALPKKFINEKDLNEEQK